MIRVIRSFEECRDFACGFNGDPHFSDPMLTNEEQIRCNLINAFERADNCPGA